MRLVALGLYNFKSFAGDHRIEFPDRGASKSLYLFGGLNGAGKTSLTHAIALTLYGERAGGFHGLFAAGRDARKAYREWLRAAFNQGAQDAGGDQMKTWVHLADGTTELIVSRAWWFNAAGAFVEERLEVREDVRSGLKVQSSLRVQEEAQAVVDQIFPRHLLDFVMFDGERSGSLDATLSAGAVRHALDRLLNLDAVERTRVEIERLAKKRRRTGADTRRLQAYEILQGELEEASRERSELADKLLHVETEEQHMQEEVEQLSIAFETALQGEPSLGTVSSDLTSLLAALGTRKSRLARVLGEWLYLWPALSILPELVGEVTSHQLHRANRTHHQLEIRTAESLADRFAGDQEIARQIGETAKTQVQAWFGVCLEELREVLVLDSSGPSHSNLVQFSDADLSEIQSGVEAVPRDLIEVQELAMDLCRLDDGVQHLRRVLALGDNEGAAGRLLRRRDELNILLGKQGALADQLRNQLATLDAHREALHSQLDAMEVELSAEADESWLRLATATAAALEEFLAQSREAASVVVRDRMLQNLRRLLHKDSFVRDVSIDPRTYATRLLGADGTDVELPSAAEQQLIAMAFIDAILGASEYPLPVFVDTPLARLDGDHRRAVVRDFWPNLGRQVVVLSTDEEVVGDLLVLAEPALAARYRVECDDAGVSSVSMDEYLETVAS